MIYVTGDTHGEREKIDNLAIQLELQDGDYLIIVGDFGFIFNNNNNYLEELILNALSKKPFKILFVDGNHECFPAIFRYPEEMWNGGKVHKIRDNIYHLMRGQVFEIEGKKIFTMGGAYSVDRMFRKLNVSYWEEEIPTKEEIEEARRNLELHNYQVDYIITHTVPSSVKWLMGFEVSKNHEEDADFTDFLDEVREKVSYKKWYAGHFHINKIVSPADNMIVLFEGVQFLD